MKPFYIDTELEQEEGAGLIVLTGNEAADRAAKAAHCRDDGNVSYTVSESGELVRRHSGGSDGINQPMTGILRRLSR